MSGKPTKMKAYESFSDWKDNQSAENKMIIDELEKLITKTAPHLATTVKWGQGCWTDNDTPKIYIHTEDDHVQLGFYNGLFLKDPNNLLSGNGKYIRFIKVRGTEDIDPDTFTGLITQAARHN